MGGLLCVSVMNVFMGCGSPQDGHQSGPASTTQAQPERDTNAENPATRSSETYLRQESASPKIA
ncbi:MAG: hypothetical protein KC964_19200, partial [Candidatus Omnitrophica bacterium]|nr:hypothetical protein [Candidatus Omnitrophota bacterium]